MTMRLEELSARTASAANGLILKRGQEQFLEPVSYAEHEALLNPATSWPRVIVDGPDGDEVIGYIMGHFDPESEREEFRACLWRVSVAAEAQGRGVGSFAVDAIAAEARSRGFDRVHVMWAPGEEGPEQFFLRAGFEPLRENEYGDIVGVLNLA